jgi:periplasmic protein TonB
VDYAQRERSLANHLPSIAVVVLLHIALGYALVSGLARKVVEVIKAPIETKIIEEIKKPPPDTPPPPPPKLAAPPPPFIPPPEINIQVPTVTQAPTITVQSTTPPPPGPPPVAVQVAPQPAVRLNFAATHRVNPPYPRQAIKDGISKGRVVALLTIAPNGSVSDVKIVSSSPPRIFDREVIRALSQWKYAPEPVGFLNQVEIDFVLKDE